jgi:hypothetical protein
MRRVSVLAAAGALGLCFVSGFFLAAWLWTSTGDTRPLAQLCARVDYINGLQENPKGEESATEEVQAELKALAEQCRNSAERSRLISKAGRS